MTSCLYSSTKILRVNQGYHPKTKSFNRMPLLSTRLARAPLASLLRKPRLNDSLLTNSPKDKAPKQPLSLKMIFPTHLLNRARDPITTSNLPKLLLPKTK